MHVVELEAKLSADESGALRDRLCADLLEKRTAVRRRIDAGLTPEEFRLAQELHDALAAAERVVQGYWRETHARRSSVGPTRFLRSPIE
jgi:hypothetical protein